MMPSKKRLVRPTNEIRFADRVSCTVAQACVASGLGKTKIYQAISDGRIETTKIDGRRLVKVSSLLKLLAS